MSRNRLRHMILLVLATLAVLVFAGLSHADTEATTKPTPVDEAQTQEAAPVTPEAAPVAPEALPADPNGEMIQLSGSYCSISCNTTTHFACCNIWNTNVSCRCEAIGDDTPCDQGGPGSNSCSISIGDPDDDVPGSDIRP